MDAETRRYLDGKFEHLEGWLKGSIEEMRREIAGSRAEMNHGFNMLNRTLNDHDRRLSALERDRPMAAE